MGSLLLLRFLAPAEYGPPMAHILHAYFFAAQRAQPPSACAATQRVRIVLWTEWLSLALALILGGIATIGRLGSRWTCGAIGGAFIIRRSCSCGWSSA